MIKKICLSVAVAACLYVTSPLPAQAAVPSQMFAAGCGKDLGIAEFMFLKSWDTCLTRDANDVPQITKLSDIWLILLPILEDAIKVAGYTAAGFVIWGGIKYLKSQGDPGQINEARQVIYNALFGLLLAMISVAIVNLVAGAF